MLIGYARVSTHDQTLNLQLDRLKEAGCTRIFEDHISGTKAERPGLANAMSHLRAGDTLVVWRLDRLGRSLRHLIDTITGLEAQGIGFRSLQENIDTTTSGGKLIFHIFGIFGSLDPVMHSLRNRLWTRKTRKASCPGSSVRSPVTSRVHNSL